MAHARRRASLSSDALWSHVFRFLMAAGSVAALLLAWLPLEESISHFIIEDCYYYLAGARSFIESGLVSLDGEHATNGFHPLWMGICILVLKVFGPDNVHATQIVLTLCAAFFAATGWLLCRTARSVGNDLLALAVGAFFLANYRLMVIALGGLESALHGLLVASLIAWLLCRGTPQRPVDSLKLGLLLGLAVLARMDSLLLAIVVLVHLLLRDGLRGWRSRLGSTSLAGVVSLALTLPWFLFSWRQSQVLLPNSGAAIKAWSGVQHEPNDGFAEMVLTELRHRVDRLVDPANDMANLLGIWPFAPALNSDLRNMGALVVFAAAAVMAILFVRARNGSFFRCHVWMPIFVVLHVGYYVVFGMVNIRYMYPAILVLLAFTVGAFQEASTSSPIRRGRYPALVAALIAFSMAAGVQAYGRGIATGRWHSVHLAIYSDLAPWIRDNTPSDARVGSFNAGIISFFSGRRTVNLDGVMNDAAIASIRERRLAAYVDEEEIDYLADLEGEIERFMNGFGGDPDWRSRWVTVRTAESHDPGLPSPIRLVVMERTVRKATARGNRPQIRLSGEGGSGPLAPLLPVGLQSDAGKAGAGPPRGGLALPGLGLRSSQGDPDPPTASGVGLERPGARPAPGA